MGNSNKNLANSADIDVTKRLYQTWLVFLDHAGKYAKRYYMARDLELPPQQQNPRTYPAMIRTYKTEKNLLGTIQRDLDTFPGELLAINAAQMACGLPGFSERDDYLAQIVMGFSILERHGKERRAFYRRKVNKALKILNGGGRLLRSLSINSKPTFTKANKSQRGAKPKNLQLPNEHFYQFESAMSAGSFCC